MLRWAHLLLLVLLLMAISTCAVTRSQVHVIGFNLTGANTDVVIRLDDRLLFWGSAGIPRRDPNVSFDLPVTLSHGTHRLVIQSGGREREASFEGTRFVTVEVRLTPERIEITIIPSQRIYI